MIDAIKKVIAAAEELGTVKDMDVLDFGQGRKMAMFEGTTPEGAPFELKLEIGFQKEEQEADEK